MGPVAERCYRRARALEPALVAAHRGEAELALRQARIGRSLLAGRRALALDDNDAAAHNDLANALLALGDVGLAIGHFRRAVDLNVKDERFHSNLLFSLCYDPDATPAEVYAEARRWGTLHAPAAMPADQRYDGSLDPDRRLRVGYLSGDFRDHPVANNVLGLIENHDRGTVAVTCYADLRAGSDRLTDRFRQLDLSWHEVTGASDEAVAAMVRADRIDLLVVLAGHTANNRPGVAAFRAAPVQISFHDVTTSGLAAMDAWLTDTKLHPPTTSERFTESLERLSCFYLHRPPLESPPLSAPPHRHRGSLTFGSCNNPAKLNDAVIDAWVAILDAVPGSRLMLKYKGWFGDPALEARLRGRFAERGIEADRLLLLGDDLPRAEQLDLLNMIDIALDPFPFNGSTTTFEALWMGVPVVTLAGERFVGRVGASVLGTLGLDGLVADSIASYRRIAAALAADHARLAELRAGLRQRLLESPLCDAPGHARAVEAIYRRLWRRWCAGRRS
jgi:protein O-GlcNAc transferase